MNANGRTTAAAEWRAAWPLTLAAMIGYSTIGLQSYGISPFVTHLEQAFGWTRSQVMIGVSLSNAAGIVLNMLIGLIVDRFGSRRVALLGLVVKTGTFALLGTATGTLLNWSVLWLLLALGVVLVQSTIWTRAVASRFDRARGLALAVALSGTPVTAMVVPPLATWLIGAYGWRMGFVGVGAVWLAVTFPVVFLFFRENLAQTDKPEAGGGEAPGLTFVEGIRTRAFLRLGLSFGCFSFYSMTVATNLVPLLAETGIDVAEAAGIASIMGLVGMVARLTVGLLLDRFPGHLIGTGTLLMPVIGCAILLTGHPGPVLLSLAVATFGAAIGAEIDVALFLATRHFGLKAFATLFGGIIAFGAVTAALGPFIGGWLHDLYGTYDSLLVAIMAIMCLGALAMLTMGRPERTWEAETLGRPSSM